MLNSPAAQVRLFARTRRLGLVVTLIITVAAIAATIGSVQIGAPSASSGGTVISFARLLTIVAGTLPVLLLTTQLSEIETAASGGPQRLEGLILAATILTATAFMAIAALASTGAGTVPATVRATAAWFGIALITGRLLGWRLCWVGPCLALSALIFWGFDSTAGHFRWWEFTAYGPTPVSTQALSIGLTVGGVLCYLLTPWRLAALSHRA